MQLAFIELSVPDWPAAVAWYRTVLGWPFAVQDAERQFALFDAGPVRVALKADATGATGVLLALQVDDLPGTLARLAEHGVQPLDGVKTSAEGYRRALLAAPGGHRLSLFAWTPPTD
jgi:predicted enzyme related to lactoylglutathione lyase